MKEEECRYDITATTKSNKSNTNKTRESLMIGARNNIEYDWFIFFSQKG